jgi:hypothetical protein
MLQRPVTIPAAPSAQRRFFVVRQSDCGRRAARESRGLIDGVLPTQRSAARFAQFETGSAAPPSPSSMPAGSGIAERDLVRSKAHAMTSLEHLLGSEPLVAVGARPSETLWRRFLQRFTGAARTGGEPSGQPVPLRRDRLPVFRITRVRMDRWLVQRPGSTIEHAFDSPASAEAFVRHECGDRPAMIELHIGELYLAAHLDPNRPSLVGAAD